MKIEKVVFVDDLSRVKPYNAMLGSSIAKFLIRKDGLVIVGPARGRDGVKHQYLAEGYTRATGETITSADLVGAGGMDCGKITSWRSVGFGVTTPEELRGETEKMIMTSVASPTILPEMPPKTLHEMMSAVVADETRDFPTLWADWVKSMIQPTKVEEFVFDEVAGIGAFILIGSIDVYSGERKSQEQCSVWIIRTDGTVRRVYYDCAKIHYQIEEFCGSYSAFPWDPDRPYKVSGLRIEDGKVVVTHEDGRTLSFPLAELKVS